VSSRYLHLTEEHIAKQLAKGSVVPTDGPYPPGVLKEPLRAAAVLIPLLNKPDGWHMLLIRRAEHSEDLHSGQVAFPGGGSHPEDTDAISTALRETREEIGVLPEDVRILGQLNDFVTISSYRVTPVVGVIPWPYEFQLAPDEVSRVFTVPLDWLADPSNYTIQDRHLPRPYKPVSVVYFKPYEGEILWGASARFTLGLISILNNSEE